MAMRPSMWQNLDSSFRRVVDPMTDPKAFSKVVFGTERKLNALYTLATWGPADIELGAIAERTEWPGIGSWLATLARDTDLLDKLPPEKGSRLVKYRALPHPFWDGIVATVDGMKRKR